MSPDDRLFAAVDAADINGVRVALADGASVHARDSSGRTPVHRAAIASAWAPEIMTLLGERGADLLALDDAGLTPIHYVLMADDSLDTMAA